MPRSATNLHASSVAYCVLTLTDGALRTMVLLYLIGLHFSAITIAIMFATYELMGIVTNFVGGVLGARHGMRFLVLASAGTQLAAIVLLAPLNQVFPDVSDPAARNVPVVTTYIVASQMLSGVSKDLMKIQGKSVPKLVTSEGEENALFRIVSVVTGMKNSIKGLGLLLGGALVMWGWVPGLCLIGAVVLLIFPIALCGMESDLGISPDRENKARVTLAAFRKGWNVNILSLARFFLFGSRDVWFEVAAPFFFRAVLLWAPVAVSGFMAGYTIIYGQLQVMTTQLYSPKRFCRRIPNRGDVWLWALLNAVEILVLGIASYFAYQDLLTNQDAVPVTAVLIVGIIIFAVLFAVSSAVHSYLIVNYSNKDKVSMDVGFYYMSNAGGRMVGTLISGFIYTYTVEQFGLAVCLWVASAFLFVSTAISCFLRKYTPQEETKAHVRSVDDPTNQASASQLIEGVPAVARV